MTRREAVLTAITAFLGSTRGLTVPGLAQPAPLPRSAPWPPGTVPVYRHVPPSQGDQWAKWEPVLMEAIRPGDVFSLSRPGEPGDTWRADKAPEPHVDLATGVPKPGRHQVLATPVEPNALPGGTCGKCGEPVPVNEWVAYGRHEDCLPAPEAPGPRKPGSRGTQRTHRPVEYRTGSKRPDPDEDEE